MARKHKASSLDKARLPTYHHVTNSIDSIKAFPKREIAVPKNALDNYRLLPHLLELSVILMSAHQDDYLR